MPLSINPLDFIKNPGGVLSGILADMQQQGQEVGQAYAQSPQGQAQSIWQQINELDPRIGAAIKQYVNDPIANNGTNRFYERLPAILAALQSGDYSALSGVMSDPSLEKYIDNKVAQQNTEQAQDFEREVLQNQTTWTGSQLEGLGLSASGVLQTGIGSHSNPGAASNAMTNLNQQRVMAQYQNRMSIARQLMSMTGSMAAAGIYGGSIGIARRSAQIATAAASHSALKALSSNPDLRAQQIQNDKVFNNLRKSIPGWKDYY